MTEIDYGSHKRRRLLVMFCALALLASFGYVGFNGFFLGDTERIDWEGTYPVRITECRYPFSSWVHKNQLLYDHGRFDYTNRSLAGALTVQLTPDSIANITFTHGLFWNAISIKREGLVGGKYTIYYRQSETHAILSDIVKRYFKEVRVLHRESLLENIAGDAGRDRR